MADVDVEKSILVIKNLNEDSADCGLDILTSAYRTLRNYCASGRHAQCSLAAHDFILNNTRNLVRNLTSSDNDESNLCMLVSLQFIANYLVDNKSNQRAVWQMFKDVLQVALAHTEPKIQNCTAMIIYNILLDNDDILLAVDESLSQIIRLTQNELSAEYAVFIMELFVCKTDYLEKQYLNLETEERLIVLNIVHEVAINPEGRSFPAGFTLYFGRQFVSKSQAIVQSEVEVTDFDGLNAREVSLILEVINTAISSDAKYLEEIQTYEDLFIHSISLLRTIHTLSKEKGNQFSMLLKIAELESAEQSADVHGHPGFGFKAALVRLVGNMCWHNRRLQDTARDMNVIPLILDCCNIDARNPLIIQWAVLAMRNLCENNLENQRVVASVDRQGPLDTARLGEMGIINNNSGNS